MPKFVRLHLAKRKSGLLCMCPNIMWNSWPSANSRRHLNIGTSKTKQEEQKKSKEVRILIRRHELLVSNYSSGLPNPVVAHFKQWMY